jgi:hypothetical protein
MGSAHGENGEAEDLVSSAVHNDVFTASVHRRSNDSTHGKTDTAARALWRGVDVTRPCFQIHLRLFENV